MPEYISYCKIVEQLDINKGDIVLLGSDITLLARETFRNGERLKPDVFIDSFIDKVGKEGTLLLPTYNWEFCSEGHFDYNNTVSKTGVLSNTALKREDFIRTQHPIYSFAVWGKDCKKLYDMTNESSFGTDSPFAYMYKNKAKMVVINLSYNDSFTFGHYVEEMEKVDYRFKKDFTGTYVDESGNIGIKTYSMYVRDLERNVVSDFSPALAAKMEQNEASICKIINNTNFNLIYLDKAYEVLRDDILYNNGRNLYKIALENSKGR